MFDCLIPFYNEDATRLQLIISTLSPIRSVGQIICIDDGSTNDTEKQIRHIFRNNKKVLITRYAHNAGKSEAIRKGLTHVASDAILTLDADMFNIQPSEIVSAYEEFQKYSYDLLILQLIEEPKQARHFRGDILLSGQRFIKTAILVDVFHRMHPHGFALEMAMNLYTMRHSCRYGLMPFSAHNIQPFDKLGVVRGIQKEMRQLWDIFSSVGLLGFLNVYLTFGKEKKYYTIGK
ncbi:MAG: Dolichol-phosphate mannosyltransferase [Microgenomates group bacterium GW2011_GWB1_40_9]|nr:MAG: Dolichol-phosphate mannosyltransferase [Microgenomates group bacterium GW2011_GWC1_39_12]KKR79158.1 MAG: Dolichol-phosphate mannosyltransferase [Microgenomates group bacterium GW2011_GWB1_40_9]